MTEIILGLTIFALLLFIAWLLKQYHAQEKRLIKALMSKDLYDFTSSELAEKPVKKQKKVDSDLIPMADLDQEQFIKAIKNNQ